MKLSCAIISTKATSSIKIAEECKGFFDKVDEINIKDIIIKIEKNQEKVFVNNEELANYDCVYIRGSHKYVEFLKALAMIINKRKTTYMPIKPIAFDIVHNKFLTQLILSFYGISSPITYFTPDIKKSKEVLEKDIKFPALIKFLKGTQGKGVIFLESYAAASSALDAIPREHIIQQYIETNGEDIRVIVMGNKVVGGMKRIAKINEVRANIHVGGKGVRYEPSEEMKEIAIKSAKILKAEIVGIDFLPTQPPLVIEANISPGLKGISTATGINFPKKVAEFLYHKTIEFKEKINEEIQKKASDEIKQLELKKIITNVNLKANKIVLPEFVTRLSKLKEDDEIIITIEDDKIVIQKNN